MSRAEERLALREGHEEMVAHVARAVHVPRGRHRQEHVPRRLRADVGERSRVSPARCGASDSGPTGLDAVTGLSLLAGDPVLVAVEVAVLAIQRVAALERRHRRA